MPANSSQTRIRKPAPKAGTRVLRGASDVANAADMAFDTPAAPSLRQPVRNMAARPKNPVSQAVARRDSTPRGFGTIGIMAAIALSVAAGLGAGTAVQAAIAKNQAPEILVQAPVQAQNTAFTF